MSSRSPWPLAPGPWPLASGPWPLAPGPWPLQGGDEESAGRHVASDEDRMSTPVSLWHGEWRVRGVGTSMPLGSEISDGGGG